MDFIMDDSHQIASPADIILSKRKLIVLLVDDQPIIAEAVRRALANDPEIIFRYCQNPKEALELARKIKPTVILQDLIMPEIDGLTMVKIFRADPLTKEIPIIVLSSKEEAELKCKAFSLGAHDYLIKLPDIIELIARVRYHAKSYIHLQERNEAFRALQESERKLAEANNTLERLTALDGLTGIANRRRFDQELKSSWSRATRQSTSLSLIMIDIDFFKLYNDHYGHQQGDECLKQVALVLAMSATRQTDIVARYGGEEFSVILPETGLKGALEIAESMRKNIEELNMEHRASLISDHITISLGVATAIPEQETNPESLLGAADQALYMAKKEGRNQIRHSNIIAG
jgi:two-component system chemotaxis family response regulator WspR